MRVPVRYFLSLAAAASLAGCEPNFSDDAPAQSAGTVDLSRYVAIGDDFAAGVANGGLTSLSQKYSFPNLLAGQFRLVGGGEFTQPLLADGESTRTIALQTLTANNQPLLMPATVSFMDSVRLDPGTPCSDLRYQYPRWAGASAASIPNNLGIPGLRLTQISTVGLGNETNQAGPGAYNAYYERILPAGSDRTYISTVRASNPTFVSISIGLSDVMPYILSGGTCGTLPTAANAGKAAGALIDSIAASTTARGIIFSVPTLPNLPLTLNKVSTVNKMLARPDTSSIYVADAAGNVQRAGFEDVVLQTIIPRIGRNETATGQPASAPFGLSPANPLRGRDVLSQSEVTRINGVLNGRGGITEILTDRANKSNGRFLYVDLKTFYLNLPTGLYINGVRYGENTVTGGLFNYDGYTLSPRGNALLVNSVLTTMASTKDGFGVKLPLIDINTLPATSLP